MRIKISFGWTDILPSRKSNKIRYIYPDTHGFAGVSGIFLRIFAGGMQHGRKRARESSGFLRMDRTGVCALYLYVGQVTALQFVIIKNVVYSYYERRRGLAHGNELALKGNISGEQFL